MMKSKNTSSQDKIAQNTAILLNLGNIFVRIFIPLVLLAGAVICFFTLTSFDPRDPSWNTISSRPEVRNIAGSFGAIVADALFQNFGMASYCLPLFFMLWAWARRRAPLHSFDAFSLLLKRISINGITIIVSVLGCLIILSSLLAYFAPGPLNAGGVGDSILNFLNKYINPAGSEAGTQIALAFLSLLGTVLFFYGARVSLKDYGLLVYLLGQKTIRLIKAFLFLCLLIGRTLDMGVRQTSRLLSEKHKQKRAEKLSARAESAKSEHPIAPLTPTATTPKTPLHHEPKTSERSSGRIAPTLDPLPRQETSEAPAFLATAPETTLVTTPEVTPPATAKAIMPRGEEHASGRASPRHGNSHPDFQLPGLDLLHDPATPIGSSEDNEEALRCNAQRLEEVMGDFSIKGEIVRIKPGPVVTMYELEPAAGTKTAKVINLSDDIARNMRALSVRISTIPGNSALGVELPNERREMVNMKEILASKIYQDSTAKLPMILGKTIDGTPLVVDLATMPHLLIAGTTGSGKSVGLNVMLLSILYRLSPDQCRVIMIDPKMLEFSVYDGIPHLLTPVVTEPKQAVVALKWTVREMENRYRLMSRVGVRNIDGYNARVAEALANGEVLSRKVQIGNNPETGEPMFETEELPTEPFPLIVIVVDEMADLMIVAGKDIEASIQRLAQMARAAGIHLIMATQRPSVDVITGTIKANFPTRISYRVTSKIDSRTIIGEQGAEQLLGKGDLLLMLAAGNVTRVHAPFVEDTEVEKICDWLRAQRPPTYLEDVTDEGKVNAELGDAAVAMYDTGEALGSEASLYDQAVAIVAQHQKASTSFVQRSLRIGYNRAADLIDEMEKNGVISPPNHHNKREVLVRSFEE